MRTVIISGATGFLGGHTVKQLLKNGWFVFALTRNVEKGEVFFGKHERLKIVQYSFGESAFSQLSPHIKRADLLIHTAWSGVNRNDLDDPEIQKQNVKWSLDLLDFACKIKIKKLIDYGSRAEYGNIFGLLSENQECKPANAYGKAKFEFYQRAREVCRQNHVSYLHLRFFSVFGKYDHPWSLISTLADKLPKGEEVKLGACLQKWNFIPIEDAVLYISRLIDVMFDNRIGEEIINVASIDTRVLKDYIISANNLFGGKSKLSFGEFIPLKDSINDVIPDVSKLQSYVSIDEMGFEKGFLKLVEDN